MNVKLLVNAETVRVLFHISEYVTSQVLTFNHAR